MCGGGRSATACSFFQLIYSIGLSLRVKGWSFPAGLSFHLTHVQPKLGVNTYFQPLWLTDCWVMAIMGAKNYYGSLWHLPECPRTSFFRKQLKCNSGTVTRGSQTKQQPDPRGHLEIMRKVAAWNRTLTLTLWAKTPNGCFGVWLVKLATLKNI